MATPTQLIEVGFGSGFVQRQFFYEMPLKKPVIECWLEMSSAAVCYCTDLSSFENAMLGNLGTNFHYW